MSSCRQQTFRSKVARRPESSGENQVDVRPLPGISRRRHLVPADGVNVFEFREAALLAAALDLVQEVPEIFPDAVVIRRRPLVVESHGQILLAEVLLDQLDQMPRGSLDVELLLCFRRDVPPRRPGLLPVAPPEDRLDFRLDPAPGLGRPPPVSHPAQLDPGLLVPPELGQHGLIVRIDLRVEQALELPHPDKLLSIRSGQPKRQQLIRLPGVEALWFPRHPFRPDHHRYHLEDDGGSLRTL